MDECVRIEQENDNTHPPFRTLLLKMNLRLGLDPNNLSTLCRRCPYCSHPETEWSNFLSNTPILLSIKTAKEWQSSKWNFSVKQRIWGGCRIEINVPTVGKWPQFSGKPILCIPNTKSGILQKYFNPKSVIFKKYFNSKVGIFQKYFFNI